MHVQFLHFVHEEAKVQISHDVLNIRYCKHQALGPGLAHIHGFCPEALVEKCMKVSSGLIKKFLYFPLLFFFIGFGRD